MVARRPVTMRALYTAPNNASDAAIPVERIEGPILLISGTDDRLWPSTRFCELIEKRLQERGFAHHYSHLRCEGAGHAIGLPEAESSLTVIDLPGARLRLNLGGSAQANADCACHAWPRIYAFLAGIEAN